ncbi:MAG: hypothetical protein IT343_07280, partial [Candidatus Melainabacteria bacterium]|nr:hypothetical protein [Candidatus Melainabacteria bacterium]
MGSSTADSFGFVRLRLKSLELLLLGGLIVDQRLAVRVSHADVNVMMICRAMIIGMMIFCVMIAGMMIVGMLVRSV